MNLKRGGGGNDRNAQYISMSMSPSLTIEDDMEHMKLIDCCNITGKIYRHVAITFKYIRFYKLTN